RGRDACPPYARKSFRTLHAENVVIDKPMAITFVKVKVANMANPRRSRRYEFLVDSGAVYTVLPESELKKLGVEPTSEEEFTLANGEIFKKSVGNALFEFGGKLRAAPVIFGDKGIFL